MTRVPKNLLLAGAAIASVAGVYLLVQHYRGGTKDPDVALGLNHKAMHRLHRRGQGFVVWERGRKGGWEIWTKSLDGGAERPIVAPEKDRDHFCPKISPDGSLLAYMSYERGKNAYSTKQGMTGSLRILNLKTRVSNVIDDQARSYCEDRAVTWLDERKLCYIDAHGRTMEADLSKGGKRQVIRELAKDFGYLPSPDLRHATSGAPEFAKIDGQGGLERQPELAGCQPYFSSDSRGASGCAELAGHSPPCASPPAK